MLYLPRRRSALNPPNVTFHPTHQAFRLDLAGPGRELALPALPLHRRPLLNARAVSLLCHRHGWGISAPARRHQNLHRAPHGLCIPPPRTLTAWGVTDLLWDFVILACARVAACRRCAARRPCRPLPTVVEPAPRLIIFITCIFLMVNSEGHMDSEGGTGQFNRVIGLRDHSLVCTVARIGNYVDGTRLLPKAARAVWKPGRARSARRQRWEKVATTARNCLALTSASNAECCACNPGWAVIHAR